MGHNLRIRLQENERPTAPLHTIVLAGTLEFRCELTKANLQALQYTIHRKLHRDRLPLFHLHFPDGDHCRFSGTLVEYAPVLSMRQDPFIRFTFKVGIVELVR